MGDHNSDDEDYFKKPTTDKASQGAAPSFLLHGKLTLTIFEADLPNGHHKINPFVQAKCGGESFKTEVDTKGDKKPRWNHTFIVNFDNAQKDDVVLHLMVTDRGTLSKNIAQMDIPVDSLFPNKNDGKDQKDPLEFALIVPKKPKKPAGKIWLSATWDGRGMPWQNDESVGSGDSKEGKEQKKSIMMHGKLMLTVHRAENLREVQLIGKQDPYVEIRFAEYAYKTKVHEKAGAFPIWNQDFLFNVDHPQHEQLSFLVYDKEPLIDNKIARIDLTIGRLLLKKEREQQLQLVFWQNYHKIGGELYVTATYTGTGAPITEEDKKKEEAKKKKEEEEIEKNRKAMEELVKKVTNDTEAQAQEVINDMHMKHEQEKLRQQEELKKKEEELKKQQEELARVQEELKKQQDEKDRLKEEAEEKARLILQQQAEKEVLMQTQDELKKLQDEVKRMQEAQAKIALDNDILRRETEAKELALQAHKEETAAEQKKWLEMETQLQTYQQATKKKEQPTEVQDPLHQHTLKLEKFIYKKGEYICDRCEKRFSGQVYHCAECRFDLHPGCALGFIAWQQSQS